MEPTEVRLARLEERMAAFTAAMERFAEEQTRASEGRRRMYEATEAVQRELSVIAQRLETVEKAVETIRPTTAELERVRDRVMFAGKLGAALWSIGKALLAAAAGAVAAYYSITGRPPP